MKIHKIELKIEFCDAVLNGQKTFEIRKDDRCYQKGDRIRFVPVLGGPYLEFQHGDEKVLHPVADREYEITYVLHGYGLQEGYAAIAIKEVKND